MFLMRKANSLRGSRIAFLVCVCVPARGSGGGGGGAHRGGGEEIGQLLPCGETWEAVRALYPEVNGQTRSLKS